MEVIEYCSKVITESSLHFFSPSHFAPRGRSVALVQKGDKQLTFCFIKAIQRVKDTGCHAALSLSLHVQSHRNHVNGLFWQ